VTWLRRQDAGTSAALRRAYNRRHRAGFLRDSERFYRLAARLMAPAAGERVLDCGCGGAPSGVILADLDADGFLDILVPIPGAGVVSVLLSLAQAFAE
jgi:hypothetical protein